MVPNLRAGNLPDVTNDAGIIFTPHGPVIVSVMLLPSDDFETSRTHIADIGRIVWESSDSTGSQP